ncbi:MAG: 50S ribosomal protein L11 methyltransferase [Pseudomonadota bacterium]
MFRIFATGEKDLIERAWSALAWTDPSPADAVDYREDGRNCWRLDAYAADRDAADACVAMVASVAAALAVRAEPLQSRDWVALSLEGLPVVRAGKFVITGAHNLPGARGGDIPICIEAGPAFGTGHHGTTLGCLLAYIKVRRGRDFRRILDVGTGTGVLAIAALKNGGARAIASDIDAGSVAVTVENATKNGVHGRLKVREASGTRHPLIHRSAPYDLVFANILARPLIRLAASMTRVTAPGGVLIVSGLLTHQAPLVRRAYLGRGLISAGHIRKDGWSTLVFRKSRSSHPR